MICDKKIILHKLVVLVKEEYLNKFKLVNDRVVGLLNLAKKREWKR